MTQHRLAATQSNDHNRKRSWRDWRLNSSCGKVCRMSGMYRMQDLLKFVTHERAEELRLEPGRPPIMVLHGKARVMDGELVTSDNIAELFHSIASEEQNQELARCGDSHFLFTSKDSGPFKIDATTNAGQLKLTVMNLTR